MELDTVGRRILLWVVPSFLLVFLFLSFGLGMKILFFLTLFFFLVFFFLCSAWARPRNPERYLTIGLLVSALHTFLLLLAGIFGLILALFILKFSPFLLIYLKRIFPF